ncbi:RidA family protein [Polaromonas sp. UC242_47]|uniref:RidA family protein n=1 Tax=Polaromonas sp. UC242_47 TaxID=3374626 RepID=UPI003790E41E
MNEAELVAGLSATPQYRYADRLGDRLFVAGQVPLDSHGQLVGPQDPSAQALQCLRNLERLLAVHEFQVTDIRQLAVYVVGDQASLSAAWSAVAGWFGGQVPPATLLGVARLGYVGQLVEIDTTVIKA